MTPIFASLKGTIAPWKYAYGVGMMQKAPSTGGKGSSQYSRGDATGIGSSETPLPRRSHASVALPSPRAREAGAYVELGVLSQLPVSGASTAFTRVPMDAARKSPLSLLPLRSSRRCSRVSDVDRRSQVP